MFASVEWQGRMKFQGSNSEGHGVSLDAYEKVGGDGSAMRPKELMLASLAGCTAMDVISILGKMKLTPELFRVEVQATETEEHPRVFSAFHIRYVVKGEIPEAKLKKAIDLSQERYCGVTAMYRQFAELSHEYIYES